MAVNERKFSDEQRSAMLGISREMSGRKAVAHLAEYGFAGAEPFDVSLGTYYSTVKREKDRAAGTHLSELARKPISEATRVLVERLITIGDRESDRMAKEQRRGALDIGRYSALIKGLENLHTLARKVEATPTSSSANRKPSDDSEPTGSLAERLLADAEPNADIDQPRAASDPPTINGNGSSLTDVPDTHAR